MKCPKCISPMVKVRFNGVEVDRCTDCQGLWFDELEKDDLLKMKHSEKIDIGDPKVGREFNRVDCILCPRCGARMVRLAARTQPHIRFEYCTVCAGSFFDAGEFRDLKHYGIADFFKDLFVNTATRRALPPRFGQERLRASQAASSCSGSDERNSIQKVILL